jgi:hypothetical protein
MSKNTAVELYGIAVACNISLQWRYVELQLVVTFHLKNVGRMKNKIDLSELIPPIDCLNCKGFRKVTSWQDRMP